MKASTYYSTDEAEKTKKKNKKQKTPENALGSPGVFLLLGEDKYYLSLAYYHFYPFLESYTCNAKFF